MQQPIAMLLSILAVTLLAFGGRTHAAAYRCEVNGQSVFTDTPCEKADQRKTKISSDPLFRIQTQNGSGAPLYAPPEFAGANIGEKTAGPRPGDGMASFEEVEKALREGIAQSTVYKDATVACQIGMRVYKDWRDCKEWHHLSKANSDYWRAVDKVNYLLRTSQDSFNSQENMSDLNRYNDLQRGINDNLAILKAATGK